MRHFDDILSLLLPLFLYSPLLNTSALRNSVNECENSGSDSGSDPDVHNPDGCDRLKQIDHVRCTHMLGEESGSDNHNETDEENNPPQQDDQEGLDPVSAIERIRITQEFICEIKASKLDNGILSEDDLYRLRSPTTGLVDISDPDTCLSIDIYLATSLASEEVYHQTRTAVIRRYPDSSILSLYEVKKLVAEISGVVAVKDDMCINSCHAFTGPFTDLETCSVCAEPRFNPVILEQTGRKVPHLQACTFLLGPQLQALRRSKEMALELQYAYLKTEQILHDESSAEDFVYDVIFLKLTPHDIMLYQNKQSDTWFGRWKVENFKPSLRFKQRCVLPMFIIPGPNKPKIIDSFTFRSLQHLLALQKENNGKGLAMWDAITDTIIYARILFLLAMADAVGLVDLDGRATHHCVHACRIGCPMKGRHKPGTPHYNQVHLRPNGPLPPECAHGDVDIRNLERLSVQQYYEDLDKVIQSPGPTAYEANRKATGISLSQDLMIPVPRWLNFGELVISLWRGKLDCGRMDDKRKTWEEHGKLVANARKYFPSSFHRPPRNPAEKIHSGFKAMEYFLYIFGLGPGFFCAVLPRENWISLCKGLHGARSMLQRSITGREAQEACVQLIQFVEEYEAMYYQRHTDRMHFCQMIRIGPGAVSSQYTLERLIGDLGQSICQPSNPFSNLAQQALTRCHINALKNMCPELDPKSIPHQPRGSLDMGNGYLLLRPRKRWPSVLLSPEIDAFEKAGLFINHIRKWGQLCLPNGQVARSLYNESNKTRADIRVTRNVKVHVDGVKTYAEVQYYFLYALDPEQPDKLTAYALVSLYSDPLNDLLVESHNELWACFYQGDSSLCVINTQNILSTVLMQPLPQIPGNPEGLWFVVEKTSIDDSEIVGGDELGGVFDI
ncbi:hypothetical protein F5877DRAFT_91280 [Lentinula edodes]|nr:hypothetical protein F5877DRAFT_91280 [Lentinula edodes]